MFSFLACLVFLASYAMRCAICGSYKDRTDGIDQIDQPDQIDQIDQMDPTNGKNLQEYGC